MCSNSSSERRSKYSAGASRRTIFALGGGGGTKGDGLTAKARSAKRPQRKATRSLERKHATREKGLAAPDDGALFPSPRGGGRMPKRARYVDMAPRTRSITKCLPPRVAMAKACCVGRPKL